LIRKWRTITQLKVLGKKSQDEIGSTLQ